MVDMQLLLPGVWRFHSDEGREFMGAVDDWLKGAYSLVEERVGARKHCVPVCLWPDARNTQTKSTTTANDQYLDRKT